LFFGSAAAVSTSGGRRRAERMLVMEEELILPGVGVSSGGWRTTVGVCGVTSPGMPSVRTVSAMRSSISPLARRMANRVRQDPARSS